MLHLLPRAFVIEMSTVVRTSTEKALGYADFEYQYHMERRGILSRLELQLLAFHWSHQVLVHENNINLCL